jgi:transcriptional regulator EpsA
MQSLNGLEPPSALDSLSDDSLEMSVAQMQALVRAIEAAPSVKRRYHFFVWMQNHLHVLLPHVLAVCGSYQRQRREVVFEAFHSVVLPAPTLDMLTGAGPAMMAGLSRAWVENQGRALALSTHRPADAALASGFAELAAGGLGHLVLHGVARPQRPAELESLFVLAGAASEPPPTMVHHFELLLPHLHTTYLRVQDTERTMNTAKPPLPAQPVSGNLSQITEREKEILLWVREGKSNLQIGEQLGISALTVKNHVQKILRKMGASNRAQAVALAMTAQLFVSADGTTKSHTP